MPERAAAGERRARAWLLAAGVAHGALALALGLGGHRPSGPTPFGDRHFLAQAALEPLVFLAMGRALGALTQRVAARLGGSGEAAATRRALAPALAAPVIFTLTLPEAAALAAGGIDGIRAAVRVAAPLTGALAVALAARAVRATHGLPPGRAALAGFAGLAGAAVVGATVIR